MFDEKELFAISTLVNIKYGNIETDAFRYHPNKLAQSSRQLINDETRIIREFLIINFIVFSALLSRIALLACLLGCYYRLFYVRRLGPPRRRLNFDNWYLQTRGCVRSDAITLKKRQEKINLQENE